MDIAQWREELDTYRTIQKMFILEGNVSDKQLISVCDDSGDLVYLEEYLYDYLSSKGYHSVVFYNRIDGFTNVYDFDGNMLDTFFKAANLPNSKDKIDIQTAMSGIRTAVCNGDHSVAVVIQMAGQMVNNPENLDTNEIEYLMTLQLAANEARNAMASNTQGWANNLIWLSL